MIEEGNYSAIATAASVWESEKGALMITFRFTLEQGGEITGAQCIAQKDGTISEITINTLKRCFGWDGLDPFWLEDPANLAGNPVELVIEHEEYQGKVRPRVRYINAPGGGMPPSADRSKILAKYGAKFRALSGGAPAAPKPKASAPPPPVKKSTPPPPVPAAPTVAPATMEEAWEALCEFEAGSGKGRDQLAEVWQAAIGEMFGDRPMDQFTPQDWGALKERFTDNVTF